MSFTQGFAQGYGLVDNTLARQRAEERQAMLDERGESRYQEGLTREDSRYKDEQNWRAQGIAIQQKADNQKQSNWEEDHKLAKTSGDRNYALQKQAADQSYELNTLKIKKTRTDLADSAVKKAFSKVYAGVHDENDIALLNKSAPDYMKGLVKYGDDHTAFVTQYQALTNEYDAIMKNGGVVNGQPMAEQKLQEITSLLKSPQSLNTMNSAFYKSLSDRFQDENIVSIGVSGIQPVGDKFAILMDIKYKDGTVKRGVPPTKGKTSDGKDELALVSLQQIKGAIGEAVTISQSLRKDVKANPERGNYFGLSQPEGEFAISDGYMFNNKTGEGKQVSTRKNELTQKDIDLGYMKYVNALTQSGMNETPMSKAEWIKQQGLGGSNQESQQTGSSDPLGLGL